MKKINTALAALLFSACAYAQNPTAIKYAKLITAQDAKKHLSIIASDAFEGRETGRPGATMAANYIAAEFKKLGLQAPVNGSYFQDVPLIETSYNVKSFSVNGTAYTYKKDFYTGAYTTGTTTDNNFSAKEIVFIGHKIGGDVAAELGATNVTGKAVLLINDGETPQNITRRIALIQSQTPSFIIATATNVAAMLKSPRMAGANVPRMGLKPDKPAAILAPVFYVTPEVANQLLINLGKTVDALKGTADAAQPNQNIKADIAATISTTSTPAKAVDVLGYLPGTDLKNEVLVFSAHYDHIGLTKTGTDKVNNGADDDGSGTTAILEIARAFAKAKKDGHGPRRSILFLGNVGEEKGLLGSEYYTDHPVFPLANTITDLNIDMIGRVGFDYIGKPDSANYVYAIGSGMLSSELHNINEAANKLYTNLVLDYKYDDPNDPNRFYYRSDHYNFAKHGVPIIFYFNGVHADYHQPGDEVSKINFALLAKRAQLVFYTGWELANRDKRPVVDVK
ncbi:peptidase M28-like protein [Mucilaginibacter gracilis]|uniref:Peptidase M28-like protein n=1 Tax=Mucilaginibacter gracilis TaxID=423350 RepID=A0A495IVZ7_9SPHI|nr:M28 family peptidase [Mucilaginibacter gracilis]RKR80168.1 peptidase M28-like protein [Mucilaginibacter gracilis]